MFSHLHEAHGGKFVRVRVSAYKTAVSPGAKPEKHSQGAAKASSVRSNTPLKRFCNYLSYLGSTDALRQTKSALGSILHPGQVHDGMRVVAFLGRGATSEVWRVQDLKQDRDYALKIFVPTSDTPAQARQRFLTKARALDEFRHPNLIRRYRLQETGGLPYFTMDVLRPLPEHLSERNILRLLDDVLAGLDALHTKGIVHRDIKPSNILLDDCGHAVLADLGVAHVA